VRYSYGAVFEVVSYLRFLKVPEGLGQPDPTLVYIFSYFQLESDQIITIIRNRQDRSVGFIQASWRPVNFMGA